MRFVLDDSAHAQSWNCYTGIVAFSPLFFNDWWNLPNIRYGTVLGNIISYFNLEMHLVSNFAVIILYQCTVAVCRRWCCSIGESHNQSEKLSSSPFCHYTNTPCKEWWLLTCCHHNKPKVTSTHSCDTEPKSVLLDYVITCSYKIKLDRVLYAHEAIRLLLLPWEAR